MSIWYNPSTQTRDQPTRGRVLAYERIVSELIYELSRRRHDDGDASGRPSRRTSHHSEPSRTPTTPLDLDRHARQHRDAAWIHRIKANDTDALAELARAYIIPLTNIASTLTDSNALIDDIVQDVLFSLWTHRATMPVPDDVAAYLHRAVRNRTISLVRRESAQQRAALAVIPFIEDRTARNDAEQRLDDADFERKLAHLLAHVPERPRQVFLLSLGGLTYAEIASTLGLTVPSVRTLMYRAARRLAEQLKK